VLALLLGEKAAIGIAEHQFTAKVTVSLERAQPSAFPYSNSLPSWKVMTEQPPRSEVGQAATE
jgi:hypothetical protein